MILVWKNYYNLFEHPKLSALRNSVSLENIKPQIKLLAESDHKPSSQLDTLSGSHDNIVVYLVIISFTLSLVLILIIISYLKQKPVISYIMLYTTKMIEIILFFIFIVYCIVWLICLYIWLIFILSFNYDLFYLERANIILSFMCLIPVIVCILIYKYKFIDWFITGFLADLWSLNSQSLDKILKVPQPIRYPYMHIVPLVLVLIISYNFNLNHLFLGVTPALFLIGLALWYSVSMLSISGSILYRFGYFFANIPFIRKLYPDSVKNVYLKGKNVFFEMSKQENHRLNSEVSDLSLRDRYKLFYAFGVFTRLILLRIPIQILFIILSWLPVGLYLYIFILYLYDVNYGNPNITFLNILGKYANRDEINSFFDLMCILLSMLHLSRSHWLGDLASDEPEPVLTSDEKNYKDLKDLVSQNYDKLPDKIKGWCNICADFYFNYIKIKHFWFNIIIPLTLFFPYIAYYINYF